MPARSRGRRVVTCSPEGSATVSFATAWLVLPASAPMLCRARADACGSTNHEAWPTARPLRNAAGLTTAGPYVTREPGGPDPADGIGAEPGDGHQVQRPVRRRRVPGPEQAGDAQPGRGRARPGGGFQHRAGRHVQPAGHGHRQRYRERTAGKRRTWPCPGGQHRLGADPGQRPDLDLPGDRGRKPRDRARLSAHGPGRRERDRVRPQRAFHLVTDPRPCLAQRGTDQLRVGGSLPGVVHHTAQPDHPALRRGEDAPRSRRDHRGGEGPEHGREPGGEQDRDRHAGQEQP